MTSPSELMRVSLSAACITQPRPQLSRTVVTPVAAAEVPVEKLAVVVQAVEAAAATTAVENATEATPATDQVKVMLLHSLGYIYYPNEAI